MSKNSGGEVTYEIVADDSQLESDLNEAGKKVEKSAKKTAKKSEDAEKESAEVKKSVKEDVTKKNEQENDKQEKDDDDSYQNREESAKSHGSKLSSIASGTAKAIGAGMLAAGTAIAGVSVAAVKSANDIDQAMNQYIASTGKSTEETERYKKVMEDIYTNNYGDSFEDIGEAMASITQNLGDLDDASLQNVTESAFALRDTFGYEIPESTRAAKAMMDNFGTSGEEAMNLIAAGAQNGLDYSGELLDSISEYSVQFAKVGLDADDMFKVFQKGAESGAFNLDKVGDAVKEFSIRAIDGSDTTIDGFKRIGLNADEMAAKFSAGGDTAKQAFQETIAALASMEDPLEQNTAGVDLFGTMWEDLGPEAVTALASIEDGAYDTAGAMQQIKDIKYDDIGSVFEGLKRSLEVLIVPLGEQLIPLLAELIDDTLPLLEDALPPIIDAVSDVIEALQPAIEDVLPVLIDSLADIGEPLMDLVNEILPVLLSAINDILPLAAQLVGEILPVITNLLSMLLPPLVEIISALLPPLIELVSALMPICESLIGVLQPILDLFTSLLTPIVNLISQGLTPLVNAITPVIQIISSLLIPILNSLGSVFSSVLSGMLSNTTSIIGNITNILRNLIDFIRNVFTGNWRGAWENVKQIFSNAVSGLATIFKAPINAIVDGWNGLAGSLGSVTIPDWVPGIGGGSWSLHTVSIEASDYDGNAASAETVSFTVDTIPPTLTLTNPADGLITNKAALVVSGETDDVTSKPVTVTVNGASVAVNSDGSFSKEITLVNGSNTITVVAADKAGKTTTVTRKVTFDTGAPVFKGITLTPNPVDCGKTFIISVEVVD